MRERKKYRMATTAEETASPCVVCKRQIGDTLFAEVGPRVGDMRAHEACWAPIEADATDKWMGAS